MKYKIYSNLLNPPISGISNFKGSEEFLFDGIWELIGFIEKKVDDIDFVGVIEIYKDYANRCVENFNPKHFYISGLDSEWSNSFNDEVFALYDLENDPDENDMTWLYFDLEIVDCKNFYVINIKPLLEGAIGEEKEKGYTIESLLYRYFYLKSLTRIVSYGVG